MISWREELNTRASGCAEEVIGVLDVLLSGVRGVLKDNLVGVYLRGSLATGDFIPATSDIDVLAVPERAVSPAEFDALADLHVRMAALPNPFAKRIEVAYIHRTALRLFEPGLRHPSIGQGEMLEWSVHGPNWMLERWTVREHGVVLLGPDPQTLIAPIPADELREAVRTRLGDWADWTDQPDDPDWSLPLGHKAYAVETMCRALHTIACGEMGSKARAVAWAVDSLPEPWRSTVARSQAWRTDNSIPSPEIISEVQRFVRWATTEGARADL